MPGSPGGTRPHQSPGGELQLELRDHDDEEEEPKDDERAGQPAGKSAGEVAMWQHATEQRARPHSGCQRAHQERPAHRHSAPRRPTYKLCRSQVACRQPGGGVGSAEWPDLLLLRWLERLGQQQMPQQEGSAETMQAMLLWPHPSSPEDLPGSDHRRDDCADALIHQDNVRSPPGSGSCICHRNAHVGLLKRRGIVHTIPACPTTLGGSGQA